MTIDPTLLGTLVTALVAALVAYLEKIRRDLAKNTEQTEAAHQAARSAEQTSNGRLSEQIILNQRLQAENYHLKRLLDALELEPIGLQALAVARARLETLRAVRPGSGDGEHKGDHSGPTS